MLHFTFGCQHDNGNTGAVVGSQGGPVCCQGSRLVIPYHFDGVLQRIELNPCGCHADHVHVALQYDRGQCFAAGGGRHLEHNIVLFVLLYREALLFCPFNQKIADQFFVVGRPRYLCEQFHIVNYFTDNLLISGIRVRRGAANAGQTSGQQHECCE